jgi:hypothetical protein
MSITHLLRVIRVSGNASKELFLSTLFPKEWINENIDYIERNFVFPMGKIPAQQCLQHIYTTRRKQWISDKILDWLLQNYNPDSDTKVLAICNFDAYSGI